jgi:uncharacterized protein
MTILITGATGLVGEHIVNLLLEQKHTVHYLSTSKSKIQNKNNFKGFYWNPAKAEIDINAFNGVTKIIHLAGATVANRWTETYKNEILNSRIASADLLFKTIKENDFKIEQFISASAIGIYNSSFSVLNTEDSPTNPQTFLAEVVKIWEEKADFFAIENINVCKVRIGIVLDKNQGALPKMLQPIKMGFGSALASGKQWQSWIHIQDLARIFVYVLEKNKSGVYNAVAPNPVTNLELTKYIAKTLKKPLFLPAVPAFMLKLILGEMSALVLESQKVSSQKISSEGFHFNFPQIENALAEIL